MPQAAVPTPKRRSKLVSAGLWVIAIVLTLACFMYQDKTGPTYPLEGSLDTAKGPLSFTFLRSETLGTDLKIMLTGVPEGVSAEVRYRRYRSDDDWSQLDLLPGTFEFSRRGVVRTVNGIGVELPALDKRAGKYEYFVLVDDGSGEPFSVTGETPVYARYKGSVPMPVLAVHILTIFASMMFALRTVMEAARPAGNYKWMLWATLGSLIAGGFIMGPIVQYYAFGVLWSGVPYGFDWTDNKVLVELVFWVLAVALNWGPKRRTWPIFLAGMVTLVVYFIPHSIFGSEYDFTAGAGRGTTG